ncbi:MAG: sensor histidine kinase KdpD [Planctomycetes bacterium]|nr:sensor histidine kinase KdpD [Planctomycetota bacterium]
MREQRPSPEEMLARAEREERKQRHGRLRVFFGAAPGVGKTYAMLEAAQQARRQGTDVVIGWVETHGRAETARLAEGLERIPPRNVEHRGVALAEFDLDVALARHPTLILVDELAHTNAPGSRHARRWQDVHELLEAGIDVYTTLNVQHVESLNDVVASITGVAVRETVPDSILDRADEIELVDLSPDDLLARLAAGKVYVPQRAELAAANFFRKGNLIALRELALRRTAERVDAQASEWKREQGISATWRTAERVLIAIDASPQSADLIRAGKRIAASLHAPWIVLTVEDSDFEGLAEADRERLSAHLALAQRLGAETLVVRGESVPGEVLAVARAREVTRILVGKPGHSRWRDLLRGSLVDALVRGSEGADVLVTSGEAQDEPVRVQPRVARTAHAREWMIGLVAVASCTGVCFLTRGVLTLADQAMLYLLGVLVASSRVSRVPALVVAVVSIAAFDFCFVPPYFTFAVSDRTYIVTFLVMLLVAISVSRRTVLLREQADDARERERRTAALFTLGQELGAVEDARDVAHAVVRQVRTLFGGDAAMFLPDATLEKPRLAPHGGESPAWATEREEAVARWTFEHGRPAGRGTDTLPGSQALHLPLAGSSGVLGTLGVLPPNAERELTPSERQMLETLVTQTAQALERIALREEAARARLAAETERTRSALLSAVSHDVRTPLASITGSAQVLLDGEGRVAGSERRALLESIRDEGNRLSLLVSNLLDITRLESGAIALRCEWCPVDEVVDSALGRFETRRGDRELLRDVPKDVLQAWMDPMLAEQALVNLLDNAFKYSAPGAPVEVTVRDAGRGVEFLVRDRGRGIPPGEEARVFESFYRCAEEARTEGAGLGLAVVRAIAHAHGGSVAATNRPGGGAEFSFLLPRPSAGEPPAAPTR